MENLSNTNTCSPQLRMSVYSTPFMNHDQFQDNLDSLLLQTTFDQNTLVRSTSAPLLTPPQDFRLPLLSCNPVQGMAFQQQQHEHNLMMIPCINFHEQQIQSAPPAAMSHFSFSDADIFNAQLASHFNNRIVPSTPFPISKSATTTPASQYVDHFQFSPVADDFLPSPPLAHNDSASASPATNGQSAFDALKTTKKNRFRATHDELAFLLAAFEANPFPSAHERIQLAAKLCLEPRQILFWYQNRRATLKKNGIVAMKPTHRGIAISAFKSKVNMQLSPLSNENPFFFIAEKGGPVVK